MTARILTPEQVRLRSLVDKAFAPMVALSGILEQAKNVRGDEVAQVMGACFAHAGQKIHEGLTNGRRWTVIVADLWKWRCAQQDGER
jgi:hypothetical protein